MIEVTILEYLQESMNCPVHAEEPDGVNPRYLVIEKTGSSAEENMLITSMIAVKSYGQSLLDAMTLNELVKAAMMEACSLDEVTDVSINSDYNFSDTQRKRYRYQAVFDITHY
ncbi:MAG: hypothetical protein MJ128_05245 [Mogibacterium sp.]|nr:hypothetical protein [Mogibacterium sp.]